MSDETRQFSLWMRVCSACQEELPPEKFYFFEKDERYATECRECWSEKQKQAYQERHALFLQSKQEKRDVLEGYYDIEHKQCNTCGEQKSLAAFPLRDDKGGRGPQCKACVRNKERIRAQIRKEKAELERIEATLSIAWQERIRRKERKQYNQHLQTHFGKTIEEYEAMARDQKGRCAICGTVVANLDERLVVDHSHVTEAVRGLLCFHCNIGLGWFRDSIDNLQNAIKYLHHYSSWKATEAS